MPEALMTYVDTATAQWTEVEPGYRRMTLVNDRESGTRIVLLQPGSTLVVGRFGMS